MTAHTGGDRAAARRPRPGADPASAGPRVAFQGELGAYSEEAVRRFFGDGVRPVPRREFREVGDAVTAGDVDYGLLPIENTLAGSVTGSYDVLGAGTLGVVGEVIAPIHHCVLGIPGRALETVTRVLSHPVALAQCTGFLLEHDRIEAVAVYDTAGAAREVAQQQRPEIAAIAGRAAAERYDLSILAADIEDRPDNQTRFLVVAARDAAERARIPTRNADAGHKTALLVETENAPGALVRVLLPFATRGINLSKLESRPGSEPWSYRFFMELETDAASARAALDEVRRRAAMLDVLGSYPRWCET